MSAPITGPLFDSEARIISLLGMVESRQVDLVLDQLLRLDAEASEEITVYISARGGDIIDALKLADAVGLMRSKITAVAFGFVEGAAILLLTLAHQRLLFPSAILSTAGLWELPELHNQVRPGIGIHQQNSQGDQMRQCIEERIRQVLGATSSLFDTDNQTQVLTADECLTYGIADAIIEGPSRLLRKHKKHENHLSR